MNTHQKPVKLFIKRDNANIPLPRVAYSGTSAAFDLACSQTTVIPAHSYVNVPTGIRVSIDQHDSYYMQVHLRSSLGFKHGLRCHIGIIDAGYTGDFGVSVVNNTDKDFEIKEGEYFAQVLVIEKPKFEFVELSDWEWEQYESNQQRGLSGFGSSGKN